MSLRGGGNTTYLDLEAEFNRRQMRGEDCSDVIERMLWCLKIKAPVCGVPQLLDHAVRVRVARSA